jgi:hypothetical protein
MASRIGAKIPAGGVRNVINDIGDMLDRLFLAPEERALFVAGWRPTIGWVCALALTWAFLLQPVAVWVVATFALGATVPAIVTDHLLEVVLAMLGIAGPSRR